MCFSFSFLDVTHKGGLGGKEAACIINASLFGCLLGQKPFPARLCCVTAAPLKSYTAWSGDIGSSRGSGFFLLKVLGFCSLFASKNIVTVHHTDLDHMLISHVDPKITAPSVKVSDICHCSWFILWERRVAGFCPEPTRQSSLFGERSRRTNQIGLRLLCQPKTKAGT